MDEAGAYDALRPRLQGLQLDPQRVENVLNHGTPDIWYTSGAIEMKYIEDWPKNSLTTVDIGLEAEQVAWLYRRWVSRGAAWIMLRAADQYILFSGFDARAIRGGLPQGELLRLACWKTDPRGKGDWSELADWLTFRPERLPICAQARFYRLRTCMTIAQFVADSGIEEGDVIAGETVCSELAINLIDYWLS